MRRQSALNSSSAKHLNKAATIDLGEHLKIEKVQLMQLATLQKCYEYEDKDGVQRKFGNPGVQRKFTFSELLDSNPLLLRHIDLYGRRYGISERSNWDTAILA